MYGQHRAQGQHGLPQWAYGVTAWLCDPCGHANEDDKEAYQRIREACWMANQDKGPAFWEGFQHGIEHEGGIEL
jgi:hypothetical protein